ncbi:hypothetical protein V6N11_007103 [Hibiscus sabdariffa]|uniref:Uncharacterized protein n=1 Tax=Hibiscus sabdariffa TaxID=183260 RepID=A0ABR2RSY7_9ROSI
MIHQKIVKKSEADDNDSGCVAAVTLTGALQRGSSPIFSQIPNNKVECRKSTPVQSCDRMACGGKEPVIGSYRRDESTCLGALLTLAFLSTTMLPTSTVEVESDSSVKFNVNRITCETDENNYVGPKEKPEPTSNSKKRMPFGNSQVATEYFDFWTSNLAFNTKSSVQAAHFKSRSFSCFPFLDNKDLAEEVNKSLTKGKSFFLLVI